VGFPRGYKEQGIKGETSTYCSVHHCSAVVEMLSGPGWRPPGPRHRERVFIRWREWYRVEEGVRGGGQGFVTTKVLRSREAE